MSSSESATGSISDGAAVPTGYGLGVVMQGLEESDGTMLMWAGSEDGRVHGLGEATSLEDHLEG